MAKDPEKVRAYNKAYRAANREAICASTKAYYASHSDKIRARAKVYGKVWHSANADKVKAYREAHRDEISAYSKTYGKKWREEHAAQKKANDTAYRKAHPDCRKIEYARNADAIKARNRKQYSDNPDPWKARSKAWRVANSAQAIANAKVWALKNRHRVNAYKKAWTLAHPEVHIEIESRRRALKKQTAVEKVDFKQILRDSKGLCGICGLSLDLFGIDFDHIVPLSRGGTHTRENIQASHSRCNRSKGAKVS